LNAGTILIQRDQSKPTVFSWLADSEQTVWTNLFANAAFAPPVYPGFGRTKAEKFLRRAFFITNCYSR
jgi:hypothetical protein